jgi:copper chaperone CopZ
VQEALAALPGVRNVTIDFPKKQVTCQVDETAKPAEDGRFGKALEEAGFGGTIHSPE